MKKTALFFLAAIAAVNFLSSCTGSGSGYETRKNQLQNNVTGMDTEGFRFLKTVYEKAHHEAELAKFVSTQPVSAGTKDLAGRIVSVYDSILPQLSELALKTDVNVPDPGMPAFEVPADLGGKDSVAFNEKAYLKETLHEQELIAEQFETVSRNTHAGLRKLADGKMKQLEELLHDTQQLAK